MSVMQFWRKRSHVRDRERYRERHSVLSSTSAMSCVRCVGERSPQSRSPWYRVLKESGHVNVVLCNETCRKLG